MSILREYMFGMDYGAGIDSLNGAIKGDAVIRTDPEEVTQARGQTIEFHMEKIETAEDLQEALEVSADVNVSYGVFGGSARFEFAESCQMHSYSVYLVVRTEVLNSFRQMRDVELKPLALELLRNGKLERFREQCGDLFVRGISTGGTYFALLELKTKDAKEQREISSEIEAKYGLGTFSAEAQFEQTVKRATARKSLQVRSFQQGGASTRQPTTAEEMVKRAVNFASLVSGDQGVAYEVLLQDYRTLDIPELPNLIDLQNAREVLQDLSIQRNKLRMQLNDINYILTNQNQFQNPDIEKLNRDANDLKDVIIEVTRAASRCINKPLEAIYPKFDIPEIILPARIKGEEKKYENPGDHVTIIRDRQELLNRFKKMHLKPMGGVRDLKVKVRNHRKPK